MNEIWKDIVGYEGLYKISNLGNIKSLDRLSFGGKNIKGRNMCPSLKKDGYLEIPLCKDKKRKYYRVHRLVAIAFIPNIENKPCIDHINTITTDNRVENLRWVTYKENSNNQITRNHISKSTKGKSSKSRKVICIETNKEYESIKEAAKELGLNYNNIMKVCQKKQQTTGGLNFRYAEELVIE